MGVSYTKPCNYINFSFFRRTLSVDEILSDIRQLPCAFILLYVSAVILCLLQTFGDPSEDKIFIMLLC